MKKGKMSVSEAGKLGQKAWMEKTTPEWRRKNAKRANSMRKANRK